MECPQNQTISYNYNVLYLTMKNTIDKQNIHFDYMCISLSLTLLLDKWDIFLCEYDHKDTLTVNI